MKHSVDVHVEAMVNIHAGQRIRHRRWEVGMTLQQLGDRIGITAQQIMKIETGTNENNASLMRDIAAALEVPVSFFFDGLARPLEDPA